MRRSLWNVLACPHFCQAEQVRTNATAIVVRMNFYFGPDSYMLSVPNSPICDEVTIGGDYDPGVSRQIEAG